MERHEKNISLNFNRKDFEEIYFKNKQHNIFLGPSVKREFITVIVFLFLLLVSTIYSLMTDNLAWFIVILSFFTILFFIPYYYKALQIKKWRAGVRGFINANEKFKNQKLILTNSSLSLVQDDNEEIHKWTAFSHIEISEKYIRLRGTSEYLFPKKSMAIEDYNYFIEEIKSHVKNGL